MYINFKCIKCGADLGRGAYGYVQSVTHNFETYAAKFLRADKFVGGDRELQFKAYYREEKVLSSLNHPNIVQYIGVSYNYTNDSPVLIMELMWKSLHAYLTVQPTEEPKLDISRKFSLLHNVAAGLKYLHSKKVIHRDLTATNVLLHHQDDGRVVAKISDFGNSQLSEIVGTSEVKTMTRVPGTRVYCAPETMGGVARYNEKVDIFSFGHLAMCTIIEEFPGEENLKEHNFYVGSSLVARTEYQRCSEYIRKVHAQVEHKHPIFSLIEKCLHNRHENRPSASELEGKLNKLCVSYALQAFNVQLAQVTDESNVTSDREYKVSSSARDKIL